MKLLPGYGGAARQILFSASYIHKYDNDVEVRQALDRMRPCQADVYRQFDFWLGNWQVQNPQGQPVGTNDVTLEQDGCLIVEHWTSGGTIHQTGTSFNYYDVRDKKWHQLYIDNSGNAGAFPAMAGELHNGKMVLLTDETATPLSRWTWYVVDTGKVRQMAEASTDHGKTWTTTWDSYYLKSTK